MDCYLRKSVSLQDEGERGPSTMGRTVKGAVEMTVARALPQVREKIKV